MTMSLDPKVLKAVSVNNQVIIKQMNDIRSAIQKACMEGKYELQYAVWLSEEESALLGSYDSDVSLGKIGETIRNILVYKLRYTRYLVTQNPGALDISWEDPISNKSPAGHSKLLADQWNKIYQSFEIIPARMMDATFNGDSSINYQFAYAETLNQDDLFKVITAESEKYIADGYEVELSSANNHFNLSISW